MFLSNRDSPPKQTCTRKNTGGSTNAIVDCQATKGDDCQPTEATVMRKGFDRQNPTREDGQPKSKPPPTPPRLTDREHSRMNTAGPPLLGRRKGEV
jgi:hypothetical protein